MGQRSIGRRLERDCNEIVTRQLLSLCLKFRTNKKKWQDFSISTKNKKLIHSPMFNHHSIIPWGSFRGRKEEKWGSFRGRDHFGGCTYLEKDRRNSIHVWPNGSDPVISVIRWICCFINVTADIFSFTSGTYTVWQIHTTMSLGGFDF